VKAIDPMAVTALTGFLRGRTMLLNRILTELHGKYVAVIENEFGEVGINDKFCWSLDETTLSAAYQDGKIALLNYS